MATSNTNNSKLSATAADAYMKMLPRYEQFVRQAADEHIAAGGSPTDTHGVLERMEDAMNQLEAGVFHANHAGSIHPTLAPSRKSFELNGQTVEYLTNTAEHALFMKQLRYGMSGLRADERATYDARRKAYDEKAMSLGEDTTGGYLSSSEFSSDILRLLQSVSPARQLAQVIPMGIADAESIPVRTGLVTASRQRETGTRAQSDMNFGLSNIPVHEATALVLVSRALAMDSKYPLDVELATAFADALAVLEAHEFIQGDGASEFVGLDNVSLPAANVVTAADSTGHLIVPDDIAKLVFKSGFGDRYIPGARLLMNPNTYASIITAKGSSSVPGYLLNHYAAQSIFGVPVTFCSDMPDVTATPAANKKAVYVLNPQYGYAIVQRQAVEVLRLMEPWAHEGKIGFYISARTGGAPVAAEAIASLVTA